MIVCLCVIFGAKPAFNVWHSVKALPGFCTSRMKWFTIFLDNPSRVYFPGDQVSGTVQIVLEKKLKAKAVNIELRGEVRTHFQATGDNDREGPVEYVGKATYVNKSRLLWSGATGCCGHEPSDYLYPGTNNFPFSFTLPMTCGPSFEGRYGSIRYFFKAKIDVPWNFDKKTQKPFSVMPVYDLNMIPIAAAPAQIQAAKEVGIFKRGNVNMKVTIPKTGFVPGECVDFTVEVTNASSRSIEKIEFKLLQYCSFTGYRTPGQLKNKLNKNTKRIVTAAKEAVFLEPKKTGIIHMLLTIPAAAPSFNSCELVQVHYKVRIKLQTDGMFRDTIVVYFPVVLGTVPIRKVPVTIPVPPPMSAGNCDASNIGASFPPQATTYNGTPPSYADCAFGKGTMRIDKLGEFHYEVQFTQMLTLVQSVRMHYRF